MALQVAESGLKFGVQLLLSHAGDDAAAGAVAAVAGAAVSDQEQHAVRVAVNEAWHRHVAVLAAGVTHFIGVFPGFLDAGDHLLADGAVGVLGVNEVEIVRRDGHGQLVPREQHAGALFLGQGQVLLQLGQGGDPVFELPGGAVPVCDGDVFGGPIARSVGAELLLRQRGGIVHVLRDRWARRLGAGGLECQTSPAAVWVHPPRDLQLCAQVECC